MKLKKSTSQNVDHIYFALKRLIDRRFPPGELSSFHHLLLKSTIVFSGKVISLPNVVDILRFGKRDSETTYIPFYSSLRLAQTLIAGMDFDKHVNVPLAAVPGWVFFAKAVEYEPPVVLNPKSDITISFDLKDLENLSNLAQSHCGHLEHSPILPRPELPSSLPFSYSFDMFHKLMAPTSSKADLCQYLSQGLNFDDRSSIKNKAPLTQTTLDADFEEDSPGGQGATVVRNSEDSGLPRAQHENNEMPRSSTLCSVQEAAAVLATSGKKFIKKLKKIENHAQARGPLFFNVPRSTKKGEITLMRYYTMEAVALVALRIRGPMGDLFRYCINQRGQEAIYQAEKLILESRGTNIPLIVHESDLELRELIKKINILSQNNAHLTKELSQKENEIQDLQKTIQSITSHAQELQTTLGAAIADYKPPKTVTDACIEAEKFYSSKLIFLDCVYKTLKYWPPNDNFRMALAAQARFRAMATYLWNMVFASDSRSIDPHKFLELSGFKLALGEGKATNQDTALTKLRTCEYEGEQIDFSAHLKARVGKTLMRLHFYVDRNNQSLVICHVGDHIPNALGKKL